MDEHGARTAQLLSNGMSRREVYGARLHRPFYGMRAEQEAVDHVGLCHAAAVVMPTEAVFSHRSAAVIHGLPLPSWAEPSQVEVSVFEPSRPPKLRGVVSHQLTPDDHRIVMVGGLRVMAGQDAWAQLSNRLPLADLVVIADFMITGDEPYSQRPPRWRRADLEAAVQRHGLRRGVRNLRLALERSRYGSLSPQETRLRLALEDNGLPSPQLNHRVPSPTRGGTAAMIDLAYPEAKIAIEYLGDHHRTDRETYRDDIRRREMLVQLGWDVIFVTAADSFDDVALRVRRAFRRSSTR